MQRTHLTSLQLHFLLSVLLFYPDHQLVLQVLANFPVLIHLKRFVIIFASFASARRAALIFSYNFHTALPGWFSNQFVRNNLLRLKLSETIYKRCCLVILCKDLSTFISFLPKCIYQLVVPKSAYCLLWASRLLLVRLDFVSPKLKTLFQGCWMSFLLLGVLLWGRLSQARPLTAGNFPTVFLALLIRQRLICMWWCLLFLAGVLAALWITLWWAPGTHHLSVSVSHRT